MDKDDFMLRSIEFHSTTSEIKKRVLKDSKSFEFDRNSVKRSNTLYKSG